MISAERRVLIEKKSYLNMAIRLKRNFKRFYFKKLLKKKIKSYNNFIKLLHRKKNNKKVTVSKRNVKFKKRKFKKVRKVRRKLRFTRTKKLLFIKKLYARGYKRRYLLAYIRRRMESLRVKKFLSRYR
jgi:hypothetical protein